MCGFAGVVVWDEKYRVSRETLGKMSARIAHRGPDGEGIYLNHEGEINAGRPQVGLVHRRLAILDLDPRANQPFTDGEGRWVVFNGEIYNFRELRGELEKLKPGYAWRTSGDTEVLLVAYDVWGEKCVEHFNGMFAFAVWDDRQSSLFLARDRMGQKPLYVALNSEPSLDPLVEDFGRPNAIAFASELSALRVVPWIDFSLNPEALKEYLALGYITERMSIYRGVIKLAPSRTWLLNKDGSSERRYFAVDSRNEVGDRDAILGTRELVTRAVAKQLVSDVPIGCFLSGGVDSSVVAAAMRAVDHGGEVLTFSIGFNDVRYDETEYAERVSRHLGTRHFRFEVTPDAALDLPSLASVFGEPFGDSSALPTHYLSRETRQHVKVALSGDGGDELFGGYERYAAMRCSENLPLVARVATRTAAAVMPGGTHPKSFRARFRRFASAVGLDAGRRYSSYVRLFSRDLARSLLPTDRDDADVVETGVDTLTKAVGRGDVVRAVIAWDRKHYLPDDLLTKVDRASMLHALEVRSPFMDHELVQFAACLTSDQLLRGGPKRMLREAFSQDLPAWVFKRKKMGFAVPIGEWFRGDLRGMLRESLFAADSFVRGNFDMKVVERLVDEHEQERVDHSQRLYALLMLELWWRGEKCSS
jgi:asparagine synthase (glutamine-hydrolysing)